MPKLINYHDKSVGVRDIAEMVESSEIIKKTKASAQVHVIGLSNEHGVDVTLPADECAFRKLLLEKGFTVARRADQQHSNIGLSLNMRKNRKQDAAKILTAYVLYKNNLLGNSNGELIS